MSTRRALPEPPHDPEEQLEEPEGIEAEMGLPVLDDPEEEDDDGAVGASGEPDGVLDIEEDDLDLDDSVAGDLDIGALVDHVEEDDVAEEGDGVDVGPLEDEFQLPDEGEDAGDGIEGESDVGLPSWDDEALDDDETEGTGEDFEKEIAELGLPDLDQGPDDVEGIPLGVDDTAGVESGSALPAWHPVRWIALEGAGGRLPCRSVAVFGARVAATGEGLLFLDDGAHKTKRRALSGAGVAVALSRDAVMVVTDRGALQLFDVRGEDATAAVGASLTAHATRYALEVAATPDRFWLRDAGRLLCLSPPEAPLTVVRRRGVLAIAASDGVLVTLVVEPSGPRIERLRGDDEVPAGTPLPAAALRIAGGEDPRVRLAAAAGGRCLALTDGEEVAVSRDGGASFVVFECPPVTAIAFEGDDVTAPLLCLLGTPNTQTSYLLRIPSGGEPARLAEVTAERDASLAWDASREVVWIASSAGLVAFGPPRHH